MLCEPASNALHRRYLACLIELPQPAEAPQLALEIAGGLAEVLKARRPPVHRVDLHQRIDQLLADPLAFRWRVKGRGDARDDDIAEHALHHIKGRTDRRLIRAHR